MFRQYMTNVLLASTTAGLLGLFACIWIYGSHYIQEPNLAMLVTETVALCIIFGFAVSNIILQVGSGK